MSGKERRGSARRKAARAALAGVLSMVADQAVAQNRPPIKRDLPVTDDQIDGGEWDSGAINFTSQHYTRGQKLIFDLTLTDKCLKVKADGSGDEEQIYFRIDGRSPGGNPGTNTVNYKWTFTGATGDSALINGGKIEITGVGEMDFNKIYISPGDALRSIELTESDFCFCDITLELTLPGRGPPQFKPESVQFKVESDTISTEQKVSWLGPGGGSYAVAGNWRGGAVPNGVGAIAEFGGAITSQSPSVALNGPVTLGALILNDNSSLSLSAGSGGSLMFAVPSGYAGLHVESTGSPLHLIFAPTTLQSNLLIHFSDPTSLNELFYNANISESVAGRSILVKGANAGGRLALNGNNSYTGGITVDHALVELNTATAQGAVGSRATAVNGGQIELGFMPTSNHRFTVGAGAMISGSSSQLGALSVGGNLELAPGAIIGFESNGSARPAGAIPGQLYYGVNGSLGENVTIGAQSGSWLGVIGSAVTDRFHGGTITVQGNAELGALGGRRLTLNQVVDITRDGSTITVRPGGEVEIVQPPGNSGTRWDLHGLLRLGNTIVLNGPVTLREGGGLGVADWKGLTITNPAYSDTFGSRLLSGDVFETPTGPDLANAGIHFAGGHTYMVNSTFAPLVGLSNPNLGVKGPNTVVRFGGTVENPDPFTFTNFTVQNGGRLRFTDTAQFLVTTAQGQSRPVLFWGEGVGGGTVEFEAGFVADPLPGTQEGEATLGLKTGVFFPGVTVVTNHGQNVPHMAFDYATQTPPTTPDTWRLATNPHMINKPVDVFRPMRIQTDVPVTATGLWSGTAPLIKTGAGTLTIDGTGRLDGTPGFRVTVPQGTLRVQSGGRNRVGGFGVSGGGTLEVTGNLEVHPGAATVNRVDGALSLGGTVENPAGQIDLSNTNVIFAPGHQYFAGPQTVIREALEEGFSGGATPWTGRGFVSGTARSDPRLAIGYGLASDVLNLTGGQTGTWMGETVTGGTGLVRLTLVGDLDLDGTVDFFDLAVLAQNYLKTQGMGTWTDGDFNYDSVVDFNDLARLAQNYNDSVQGAVPGASPQFDRDWAAAMASVPEPGSAVVGLAMLAGLRRRRCR